MSILNAPSTILHPPSLTLPRLSAGEGTPPNADKHPAPSPANGGGGMGRGHRRWAREPLRVDLP
ncbi:hypothetical protein J2850_004622 [Azospirillum picis]|uniref:Uncharacterized protein n=1 Tax=Azospirillum picis TaxID=488438 RepID=A0ABU0MUU3_9PROT|nr:hypothetical protein [Azospirillum picis]MDQ0537247.1 hypothetical protein [Azospirillum picis]